MRKVLRRYRHREGDGEIHFRAALDGAPAGFAQIGAAQEMLALELDAIELQVKLEPAVIEAAAQLPGEFWIVCDPDAVRVQEQVIDPGIFAGPGQELEELRMQGRLAAGKLENLDTALAIDHALDAILEIGERNGVDVPAGADGRIRVTGGTGEIARVHDLDERETGGEFLEGGVAFS